jgi:hypothetical protein
MATSSIFEDFTTRDKKTARSSRTLADKNAAGDETFQKRMALRKMTSKYSFEDVDTAKSAVLGESMRSIYNSFLVTFPSSCCRVCCQEEKI